MTRSKSSPKIGLIMTTALASVALAGCTTGSGPRAEASFSKAQAALSKGKVSKAITYAEAAVLAEPRNSGYRAMLGAAYLEAGRFQAAATSFNDALELGDSDPRTVLSYALASTALGNNADAVAALKERESAINPADLGLAFALAGEPEYGVHVLTNALRGGMNTAKLRQNLAYTYALAGNWRAARVMAAEDVPADQLDARLSEWAANAKPEDVMKRVSKLLGVTVAADSGQPQHLSLVNFPDQDTRVAEAAAQNARELTDADLASAEFIEESAPVEVVETSAAPSQSEAMAFGIDEKPAEPVKVAAAEDSTVADILKATGQAASSEVKTVLAAAPAAATGPRFVSNAVVQKVPESAKEERKAPRRVASASSQRRMAATNKAPKRTAASDKSANTHLVQLGSYGSRDEAKRGWVVLKRKFPELKGHDLVITKAKVKGKIFYRVAAAGFGPRSARSMCGSVKSAGRGCFAYAASNPPKGAIDRGVRIAARSR